MKHLEEMTPWGRITMVGSIDGERYYWMISDDLVVSMIPADVVEVVGNSWTDGNQVDN